MRNVTLFICVQRLDEFFIILLNFTYVKISFNDNWALQKNPCTHRVDRREQKAAEWHDYQISIRVRKRIDRTLITTFTLCLWLECHRVADFFLLQIVFVWVLKINDAVFFVPVLLISLQNNIWFPKYGNDIHSVRVVCVLQFCDKRYDFFFFFRIIKFYTFIFYFTARIAKS